MSTVASSNSDLTLNADGSGNDIKINSNGTQVARVTAEGTLGVGTDAAPTSNLQIHEDSTGHCTIDITNTTTTNAALKGLKIGRGSDGAGGHGILLNYEDNKDWVFSASTGSNNATEKMRLTSAGHLLVGKAASALATRGNEIRDNGCIFSTCDYSSTSDEILIHNTTASSGGAYSTSFRVQNTEYGKIAVTTSGTSYLESSDYRLKENVVALDGALDRLAQLKTYRFNFKADPETTVDGFVAHEVADVVPEAVTGEKDAMETVQMPIEGAEPDEFGALEMEEVEQIKPQGIDKSKLIPLLVAAVQELSAKVQLLEEQLNAN